MTDFSRDEDTFLPSADGNIGGFAPLFDIVNGFLKIDAVTVSWSQDYGVVTN